MARRADTRTLVILLLAAMALGGWLALGSNAPREYVGDVRGRIAEEEPVRRIVDLGAPSEADVAEPPPPLVARPDALPPSDVTATASVSATVTEAPPRPREEVAAASPPAPSVTGAPVASGAGAPSGEPTREGLEGLVLGVGATERLRIKLVQTVDDSVSTQIHDIEVDAGGRFAVSLAPGTFEATVLARHDASPMQRVTIVAGETARATFLVGGGAPLVLGVVRSALTGMPLEGARVLADRIEVATDARGEFALRGGAAVPAAVEISAPGHVEREVTIDPSSPPPVELIVELAPAAILRVTVTDASGAPVRRAWVRVQFRSDVSGSTTSIGTNAQGVVVFDDLPERTYTLTVDGDPASPRTVALRAGFVEAITIALPPK